jgi:hypothetical protein
MYVLVYSSSGLRLLTAKQVNSSLLFWFCLSVKVKFIAAVNPPAPAGNYSC